MDNGYLDYEGTQDETIELCGQTGKRIIVNSSRERQIARFFAAVIVQVQMLQNCNKKETMVK